MTIAVFIVILVPVFGLVSLFPSVGGMLTLIIALGLAWGIKQAAIEPIGMTALMQVFFKGTEGQEPNPEWDARLNKVPKKFGTSKDKAQEGDLDKGTAAADAANPPQS